MKFCDQCGVQLNDNAKYCSACGNLCEIIEVEKKVDFCKNCGSELGRGDLFCPECGVPCCIAEEYKSRDVDPIEIVESGITKPSDSDNTETSSSMNYLCLILLVGCAILWFTAPFIAINILTLGDQPTALQLVMDDVTYIGELTESSAYWAAIISIIGIIICFISTIASAHTATRIVAVVTELPLMLAMFDMISWADDIEELFEALGLGFWGMFIMLLVVVFTGTSNSSTSIE